jgi:hypothetical protein
MNGEEEGIRIWKEKRNASTEEKTRLKHIYVVREFVL